MKRPFRKLGTIIKVVHVCVDPNQPVLKVETESPQGRGYGVLRGTDGEEVFFVDSVVDGEAFASLRVGENVLYDVEEGPFARARHVQARRRE